MYSMKPLSKNREYIYHFLRRMKRFNCPISVTSDFDISELVQKIEELRSKGRNIGFISFLTKATAKTIEAHPILNERLFHTLFGKRVVQYDEICCGMLAERKTDDGEHILIPINIRDAPNASIESIHERIKRYKTAPLEELKGYHALNKVKKLPRWLIPLVHWMLRLHPGVNAGKGNTYAISAVLAPDRGANALHAPAYKTTFCPINIQDKPVVHEGAVAVRRMLTLTVIVDHYLLDGMDLKRVGDTLRGYLEDPATLLDSED